MSLLSLVPSSECPSLIKGEEWKYISQIVLFWLFDKRFIIGIFALGILVLISIISSTYNSQQKFREEACTFIRRNIDFVAQSEIQVSIFITQCGLRTLLTYIKNVFIALTNPTYWKKDLLKTYCIEKFPNIFKKYHVRKEQSGTKHSHRKPTIYFQETFQDDEENGFLSYYLANLGDHNILSIDPYAEADSKKYLRAMKLKEYDFKCLGRKANFVHVEPLVNKENEYIGALVIDITHSSKIQINGQYQEYQNMIKHAITMIINAHNNIE